MVAVPCWVVRICSIVFNADCVNGALGGDTGGIIRGVIGSGGALMRNFS